MSKLITKAEYAKLSPFVQGYVTYMQAELSGSRIPKSNPYDVVTHSEEHAQWIEGANCATMHVQDGEE